LLPIKQLTLGFVAIATATSMSAPAAAQERACPYIRCFLSIQHDAGRVVQGAAATPVAEFGAFAPRIDLLANGSDSTRHYYQGFRAAYNRGSAFHHGPRGEPGASGPVESPAAILGGAETLVVVAPAVRSVRAEGGARSGRT